MTKYVRGYTGMRHMSSVAGPLFEDDDFEQRLDSIPYLLGVKNGVVDLRTGKLRERREEDFLYRLVNVNYDEDAESSLIEDTVLQMMAEDTNMVEFLQKLLGYGLTGEVSEEIFPVFTAGGRNGKGVLLQTIKLIMGDFYRDVNKGLIVEHRMANGDAERGKLLGSRLVVFNELQSGDKLLASEVQLLSGGDGIPAKQLYQNPITISPRHLCLLSTNHMPEVSEVIPALMERLLCVPFPVHFKDLEHGEQPTAFSRQRDNDLKKKLAQSHHLEGVLKWMVQGAVKWYATRDLKRNAPEKVKEFSRKYFEEQDKVSSFIRQRCEVKESFSVSTSEFMHELNDWLSQEDHPRVSAKSLSSTMQRKGFAKRQTWTGRINAMSYIGLRIMYNDSFDAFGDTDS